MNHFIKYKVWYTATVIFIANFILKYIFVRNESMYGDESHSLFLSQQPIANIFSWLKTDQNPPLYYIILHYYIKIFGLSLAKAKALSVFFSSLTASGLFILINRYSIFRTALFACLLFTFSTAQIYFASEVRCFAMVQFLCVVSSFLFLEQFRKASYAKALVLAFVNAALLYAHFLTVFILVVQGIIILIFYKRKLFWHFILSCFISLLLLSPWLLYMAGNVPDSKSFWMKAPTWHHFMWAMEHLHGNNTIFYFFIACAVIASGAVVFMYRKMENKFLAITFFYFACLYTFPPLLNYALSSITPVFQYRYFLYSLIGLCAAVPVGLHIVFSRTSVVYSNILMVLVLTVVMMNVNINPPKGDDWNVVVPKIMAKLNNKTAVIISAPYKFKEFAYYYDKKIFADYDNTARLLASKNIFGGHILLNEMLSPINFAAFQNIILVQSHHLVVDPQNTVEQLIYNHGYTKYDEYQKDPETGYAGVKVSTYITETVDTMWYTVQSNRGNVGIAPQWNEQYMYNPVTMDTVLMVQQHFSSSVTDTIGYSIPDEKAFEYVDGVKQYGANFSLSEKQLPLFGAIRGEAGIYLNDTVNTPAIVISIEDGTQNILYKAIYILHNKEQFYKKWGRLPFAVSFPANITAGAKLNLYLFAGSMKEKGFINNMKLFCRLAQ